MKRLSAFGALVLIAPLLVPRAASADDDILVPTAADDRAVSSCLQRAEEDGTAPAACIGLVADLCLGEAGEETTVVLTACHEREATYWDEMLNDRYATVTEQLDEVQALALRDAQRAWIPMRDETCAFEASLWDGGTGAGPAASACFARETGLRALFLDGVAGFLDER